MREWLEIFGIFGVILSLIFVGLEMRQSQRIALSSIYQARSDSSMRVRMAPLESEILLSGTAKLRNGLDLSPEEEEAIVARVNGNIIYLENVHFQYTEGFLSEEHWQTNRAEIRGLIRTYPFVRERVESTDCAKSVWRESFCRELKTAAEAVAAIE